jgi:hypothetical protein
MGKEQWTDQASNEGEYQYFKKHERRMFNLADGAQYKKGFNE